MRAVYWCNKKWGSEKRGFFPSSMARKHFFAAPEAPIFFFCKRVVSPQFHAISLLNLLHQVQVMMQGFVAKSVL